MVVLRTIKQLAVRCRREQHPLLAEWRADDVLRKSFDAVRVAGGKEDILVDAESGVSPATHGFNRLLVNASFIKKQSKDVMFPYEAENARRRVSQRLEDSAWRRMRRR